MDLRQILLLERASGDTIEYTGKNGKRRISNGTWVDQLTGVIYRAENPNEISEDVLDDTMKYGTAQKFTQLQIDHLISLQWACEHGADQWSAEKRKLFATDERLLVITLNRVNASKGNHGADTWQPHTAEIACWYNKKFLFGVSEYALDVSEEELRAYIENQRTSCNAAATN